MEDAWHRMGASTEMLMNLKEANLGQSWIWNLKPEFQTCQGRNTCEYPLKTAVFVIFPMAMRLHDWTSSFFVATRSDMTEWCTLTLRRIVVAPRKATGMAGVQFLLDFNMVIWYIICQKIELYHFFKWIVRWFYRNVQELAIKVVDVGIIVVGYHLKHLYTCLDQFPFRSYNHLASNGASHDRTRNFRKDCSCRGTTFLGLRLRDSRWFKWFESRDWSEKTSFFWPQQTHSLFWHTPWTNCEAACPRCSRTGLM